MGKASLPFSKDRRSELPRFCDCEKDGVHRLVHRRLRLRLNPFPMQSKAKFLGHPLHPILIAFPLGLLPVAVLFDCIHLGSGNGLWAQIAYYLIAVGVLGGLLAALFGTIDWLAIPAGTRAKRIGSLHGAINVAVMALFALSWWLRRADPTKPGLLPIVLGIVALGLAGVAGWLGGELIYRLSVGVDEGAHLDASNSLTHRSARD